MKNRIIINFIVFTITLIGFRYLTESPFEMKMIYSSLIGGAIFTGLMVFLQEDKINNKKLEK